MWQDYIKNQARSICSSALSVILPARCPLTGEIVESPGLLSSSGWGRLDFIDTPICSCCGLRLDLPIEGDVLCPVCVAQAPDYTMARAALAYDDASRELILSFKHGDQTHLVRALVPLLARAGGVFQGRCDLVVPVPLHRWRLLRRRYNQAALLAAGLAALWDKSYDPDCLVRVKATPSQGHFTRAMRHSNVAGAFRVPDLARNRIAGKRIVLVDDVYTTGATVNACARALTSAGASEVNVLCVARVIRPGFAA